MHTKSLFSKKQVTLFHSDSACVRSCATMNTCKKANKFIRSFTLKRSCVKNSQHVSHTNTHVCYIADQLMTRTHTHTSVHLITHFTRYLQQTNEQTEKQATNLQILSSSNSISNKNNNNNNVTDYKVLNNYTQHDVLQRSHPLRWFRERSFYCSTNTAAVQTCSTL